LGKIYYESMLPILTIASVRFNYEATGVHDVALPFYKDFT